MDGGRRNNDRDPATLPMLVVAGFVAIAVMVLIALVSVFGIPL